MYICCTRFNNETYRYYELHSRKYTRVYGTPCEITNNIRPFQYIYVIEMNLDTNKIIGIGYIKNNPFIRKYRIYPIKYERYNRFNYSVLKYYSRDDLKHIFKDNLLILESYLFTGKGHLKRGQGITNISKIRLQCIQPILKCIN